MKKTLSLGDLTDITSTTLDHYESLANEFWDGTKDHDVTENYTALLEVLPERDRLRILDFGCGPGRDLMYFKSLGHEPVGLDGSITFCKMARMNSGCTVLHQNFLELELPTAAFDGVFANASLFHIPSQEIVRVLQELRMALVPDGILFSSNPRGSSEGWSGDRYGTYMEWDEYRWILDQAGFEPLHHYYRPTGQPRVQQPWLAVVCKVRSIDRAQGAPVRLAR